MASSLLSSDLPGGSVQYVGIVFIFFVKNTIWFGQTRWHVMKNYGMLMLIQSLISRVNVYFPVSDWGGQTRGNTSFWKFDQSYFDRVQHHMIYDGVQILLVWSDFVSRVITCYAASLNNTHHTSQNSAPGKSKKHLTFNFWSKTARGMTFPEFFFWFWI